MVSPLKFDEYEHKYPNAELTRTNGVLMVKLHTEGGSLTWTQTVHDDLGYLFTDIACDRENAVVILTGTGDAFCNKLDGSSFSVANPQEWDNIIFDGKRLLNNLLDIPVPVIGAVNGPLTYHPELPVLSDIVLGSDSVIFQDIPHFHSGVVPGDGTSAIWTHLLGPNRGRYFILTGQVLDADTALDYGVVSEVLPSSELMNRAWDLAEMVASKPFLTRRYARTVLTHEWKRILHEGLGIGLALQGLGTMDHWPLDDH